MGKVYYIKDKKKFDEAFDAVAIPLRKTEKPKISSIHTCDDQGFFSIDHGDRVHHYEVLEDHKDYFLMRNVQTGAKFQISKHTLGIVGIVK
jgi:hypothetical protein